MKRDITTHSINIDNIKKKECCEQFYAHRFDNLDEIDQSLEGQNSQNLHKKK